MRRSALTEGPKFGIERLAGGARDITLPDGVTGWFVPVTGSGVADGVAWKAGECLTLTGTCHIDAAAGSDVLFAYPGDTRI